ncbi:hypothetical protein [Actinokineospora alba]|uniref:hypothetical protein n=1 Tax=Actinokineospora alba TaxID=504798 RepID=UPI0014152181|nr:hypothetical protein [Actinokineospora alba]
MTCLLPTASIGKDLNAYDATYIKPQVRLGPVTITDPGRPVDPAGRAHSDQV